MDPLTMWLMIAGMASSAVGSGLQANSASNAQQMNDQQFNESRQDSRMKALSDFLANQQNQDYNRSGAAMQATQLDPYVGAKKLNEANVRRSYAAGLGPDGKLSGPLDMSALSPENLSKNGDLFYSQMGALNPSVPVGPMSTAAGDVQAKELAKQQAMRKLMHDYLSNIGMYSGPNNMQNLFVVPNSGTPIDKIWGGGSLQADNKTFGGSN